MGTLRPTKTTKNLPVFQDRPIEMAGMPFALRGILGQPFWAGHCTAYVQDALRSEARWRRNYYTRQDTAPELRMAVDSASMD